MAVVALVQGTGTAPAPQAPPIPVAPARPGAATGAQGAATAQAPATATSVGQATDVTAPQAGTPQIIIPPPYRNRDNEIPAEVIPIVGIVFGTLLAAALGYPIIRMITRVIERATDKRYVRGQDVEVQLKALQESIDTMAVEIERISESQRFQSKLLSDRKNEALGQG